MTSLWERAWLTCAQLGACTVQPEPRREWESVVGSLSGAARTRRRQRSAKRIHDFGRRRHPAIRMSVLEGISSLKEARVV